MSIEKALAPWLSRPTWFTSHPSDQALFRKTVLLLKKLPITPSAEELEQAILERVEHFPAMLGTPKDIPTTVRQFAIKLHAKL
ncbi:hypothetical protein ACWIJ6_17870 [Aeromonas piscicola]